MPPLTDEEIRELLEERDLVLDEGCLIAGPFIPDGTVRIYAEGDPYTVLGEGQTIQEAYGDLEMRDGCGCC
jgi:methylmalonyl-CoA mutase cobalamin-binding subunit